MIPDNFYLIRYWQRQLPKYSGAQRRACQKIIKLLRYTSYDNAHDDLDLHLLYVDWMLIVN